MIESMALATTIGVVSDEMDVHMLMSLEDCIELETESITVRSD
jgi:hypothetical protein